MAMLLNTGPFQRSVIFIMLLWSASVCSVAQVYEAEKGSLSGTQVSTSHSGYTGTGYVTGFDADGDKVTLSFDARAGIYNLYVRYACPSGDKNNFIYINGQNTGSSFFPATPSFTEKKIGKIFLNNGANTIALVKDWGYFEVDNIRLEPATPADIHRIAETLVTPSPTRQADSLYSFLSGLYGKVVLSGQWGGATELTRIKDISGKTPVIRGFDMMDYSPSRVQHGATSSESENAIAWSQQQKGIVTFCWHWNAPKDLIDQPGKEWWRGFYTDATNFDVSKAMNSTSSEEYTLILRDIDAIAVQLKKLSDAHIPVLWRPLHEAEGKWFWWGAKGSEPCKWLWKLLFDRLTHYHHISNLIWIWTSTDAPAAMDWYPGDDYVDIIGADIYLPNGTYSSSFTTFDNLVTLYGGKKIITLSENGPIPDAEKLFVEGAAWSWFCTWAGSFITDGTANSADHIKAVYTHEYVITLDEVGNRDAIIASLDTKRPVYEPAVVAIEQHAPADIAVPNPVVNDKLIVRLPHAEEQLQVLVYDSAGKMQLSRRVSAKNTDTVEIDLAGKPSGIYIVKIITSAGVYNLRISKI